MVGHIRFAVACAVASASGLDDCDINGCFDRCDGKYGDHWDCSGCSSKYCSKGCALISDGKIQDADLMCDQPADERYNFCMSHCGGEGISSDEGHKDECRWGCGYWQVPSPTPSPSPPPPPPPPTPSPPPAPTPSPTPTGTEVDVEDFGARADNKTVSSIAINQALIHVSQNGGGIVHVRGGGSDVLRASSDLTYRVASIEMQSNVELRIAPNVKLHASEDKGDWTSFPTTPPEGCQTKDGSRSAGGRGLVFFANDKKNFKIRGGGNVDGGGRRWNQDGGRSNFLVFVACSDVVVEDLTIKYPAAWTMVPQCSERLIFRRLRILGDPKGPNHKNTDGFDPYSCKDVQILDSYYEAGDDCVAVKSGEHPCTSCTWMSENILVNNLTCAGGHGLTIGSEVSGGIRNVTFSNIDISNSGPSVRIKSFCGRGATVSDITYENIKASNVEYAIWFDMQYASDSPDHCDLDGTTQFRDITVRNLVAKDPTKGGIRINGLKIDDHTDMFPIQGLTLDNVQVSGKNADVFCSRAEVIAHDVSPKIKSKDGTCNIKTNMGSTILAV